VNGHRLGVGFWLALAIQAVFWAAVVFAILVAMRREGWI